MILVQEGKKRNQAPNVQKNKTALCIRHKEIMYSFLKSKVLTTT